MNRYEEAIRRLADELAGAEAPPGIESAVMVEFGRVRRRRRVRYWAATAAVAASILAAVGIMEHRPGTNAAGNAPPEAEQPFVAIPYVLPPGPYERVEIVRMQVPVAALIAAGLRVETADPSAQAEADVLIGQDGRPRAVRLVSISSFN